MKPPSLCNLEELLAGPQREATLTALLARLAEIAQRLQNGIDQGLEPETFRQWQACNVAVNAAIAALQK